MRWSILLLPLAVYGCISHDGESKVFRGCYSYAYERSEFCPPGHSPGADCYWLSGEAEAIKEVLGEPLPGRGVRADMEVRATLSAPGNYGHYGASSRELRVSEIIEIRPREADCP